MPHDFYRLARGDELRTIALRVSGEDVRAYLEATGEPAERWTGAVPPLAPGAFVLAALVEQLPLPSGALHTGQEFEFLRTIVPDEPLEARLRVAQRSERRGRVIVAFELELRASSVPVLRGRSTVVAPARKEPAAP